MRLTRADKNSKGKAQLRVAYESPVSDSGIDMAASSDEAKAVRA